MSELTAALEIEQAKSIIDSANYYLEYRRDRAAWEEKYGIRIPGLFGSVRMPPPPPFAPSVSSVEWAEKILESFPERAKR